MVPVLLSLLLLLGPAVLQETGTYSVVFYYFGMSVKNRGRHGFKVSAFLDEQPFYNDSSDDGKPHRGPDQPFFHPSNNGKPLPTGASIEPDPALFHNSNDRKTLTEHIEPLDPERRNGGLGGEPPSEGQGEIVLMTLKDIMHYIREVHISELLQTTEMETLPSGSPANVGGKN